MEFRAPRKTQKKPWAGQAFVQLKMLLKKALQTVMNSAHFGANIAESALKLSNMRILSFP